MLIIVAVTKLFVSLLLEVFILWTVTKVGKTKSRYTEVYYKPLSRRKYPPPSKTTSPTSQTQFAGLKSQPTLCAAGRVTSDSTSSSGI